MSLARRIHREAELVCGISLAHPQSGQVLGIYSRTVKRTDGKESMSESFGGVLLALFLFIGRWCPERLTDASFMGPLLSQPRTIVTLAIGGGCLLQLAFCRRPLVRRTDEINRRSLATCTGAGMALLVYMAITSWWSPPEAHDSQKVWEMLMMAGVHASLGLCLAYGDVRRLVWWFWLATAGLTTVMAGLGVYSYVGQRLSVMGGGPNVYGRSMVLWIVSVAFLLRCPTRGRGLLWMGVLVAGTMLTILTASRGAAICLAIALPLLIREPGKLLSRQLLCPLMGIGLALGVIALQVHQLSSPFGSAQSFVDGLLSQQHPSGRAALFSGAYLTGMKHPWFGIGLDGFRYTVNTEYPHNIFLEVFAEGGAMGLVLLMIFIGSIVRHLWANRRRIDGPTLSGCVAVLVAAQFSGDLFASRGVFLLALLALVPTTSTNDSLIRLFPEDGETRTPAVGRRSHSSRSRASALAVESGT